jgi:hypothetical protein
VAFSPRDVLGMAGKLPQLRAAQVEASDGTN